jgi:hypothetical protein
MDSRNMSDYPKHWSRTLQKRADALIVTKTVILHRQIAKALKKFAADHDETIQDCLHKLLCAALGQHDVDEETPGAVRRRLDRHSRS